MTVVDSARPVLDAAKRALTVIGGPTTLVTMALAAGIVTNDQASAIVNLAVLALPALHAGAQVATAFHIVKKAEPNTVPYVAPPVDPAPYEGPTNGMGIRQ